MYKRRPLSNLNSMSTIIKNTIIATIAVHTIYTIPNINCNIFL